MTTTDDDDATPTRRSRADAGSDRTTVKSLRARPAGIRPRGRVHVRVHDAKSTRLDRGGASIAGDERRETWRLATRDGERELEAREIGD
jgi:hypothetical protein